MSIPASKAHSALADMKKGAFVRTPSIFRDVVSDSHEVYKPEAKRYHLFLAGACPWANRCRAVVFLKGLEDAVGISMVAPTWQRTRPEDPEDNHSGWVFYDSKDPNRVPLVSSKGYGSFDVPGCDPCPLKDANGVPFKSVRDLYDLSSENQNKEKQARKFTVPVLWDLKTNTIVNNESSEIIRMLDTAFTPFATKNQTLDLYPEALRAEIDAANEWIYPDINDGVYKSGFAHTQEAYLEAVNKLFDSLDRLEGILSESRWIAGKATTGKSQFTEADLRVFMTLVRFDEVYVVYFKCNKKRLIDYPNIRQYCRDVYQFSDGLVGKSVDMRHIKEHYYTSHPSLNAYSVVPIGPNVVGDLIQLPEGREALP